VGEGREGEVRGGRCVRIDVPCPLGRECVGADAFLHPRGRFFTASADGKTHP
jgi:hypothetical protein